MLSIFTASTGPADLIGSPVNGDSRPTTHGFGFGFGFGRGGGGAGAATL
jgi:hypothetical protein